MNLRKENCYIITGGPGVGKTTLINELTKIKFKIIPESAREIIKQEIEKNGNGLPWKDRELYTNLMLEASLEDYNSVPSKSLDIYFFDRGILDAICYATMIGMSISTEMDNLGKNNLYNQKVFILPPWQEIYHIDNERKQTWEEAALTFGIMKETYLNYNYEIIEVPIDTIENRVNFILNNINY